MNFERAKNILRKNNYSLKLNESFGVRDYTTELLEKLEYGELDWEDVCRECLSYMSEDDIKDMVNTNDWFSLEDEDEDDLEDEE